MALKNKKKVLLKEKIDITGPHYMRLGKGPFTSKDIFGILKYDKTLKVVRGNIITNSLWIEDALDTIIEVVIFPENKKSIFRETLYDDLKFRQKGNIFKEMIKNKLISVANPDEVIRQIQEIITIRNNFAHGKIIFYHKQTFLNTQKDKKIRLDKPYFDKINDDFTKAISSLDNILSDLQKKGNKITGRFV